MINTLTNISQAVSALSSGKLVILPTETVYGLGADAENAQSVDAIYKVKGRPSHNPLIVHVKDITIASHYGKMNKTAQRLANVFWPGPLTIIVTRNNDCPLAKAVSAGGETVAMRSPNHPVAQELLEKFGKGIAAPSANRSGRVSPTTATHAESEFTPLPQEIAMILDGGPCQVGIESTVIDCTEEIPLILRPGSITQEMIEAALCRPLARKENTSLLLKSPGMLESHYAPSLPVRLNATDVMPGEALLAFGKNAPPAEKTLNLSEAGDLNEAASQLFAALRTLDNPMYSGIAVMPVPEVGIGIAINDRLKRAAAKKD